VHLICCFCHCHHTAARQC